MACCDNHDRMDKILTTNQFNDADCGTPTNPSGEPRYCCRKCPAIGQPLRVKAVWVGNLVLMSHLSDEEQAEVQRLVVAANLPVGDMLAGSGLANAREDKSQSGSQEPGPAPKG